MKKLFYLFPAIAWTLFVFYSLLDEDPINAPKLFLHSDKVIHFGVFGLLAFLYRWGMVRMRSGILFEKSFIISLTTSVLLAILSEVLQGLTTANRSAEMADLVADVLGVWAALWFYDRLKFTFFQKYF